MDQTQPRQDKLGRPVGNFVVNYNYDSRNNPRAPQFKGRVSAPEAPEVEFEFSAFRHLDDKNNPYWIGPVTTAKTLRQASYATSLRGHHFVTIRENGFKIFKENPDGTPNPAYEALSDEDKAKEDAKPSYWGSWTRNPDNDPVLKLAAWDRDGQWTSGNSQHPISKEEAQRLKDGLPPMEMDEPRAEEAPTSRRSRAPREKQEAEGRA